MYQDNVLEYLANIEEGKDVRNMKFSQPYNTSRNGITNSYNSSSNVWDKQSVSGAKEYDRLENEYRNTRGSVETMVVRNAEDGYVYLSESGDSWNPTYDTPILHASQFADSVNKVQSSSSMSAGEIDKAIYHTMTPEYANKFAELLSGVPGRTLREQIINLTQHGSGIITSKDYLDLNTGIINAQLIRQVEMTYVLERAFQTINTNELEYPFDEFEKPEAQEDLGEIEIPKTTQGKYTSMSLGLKKDGSHLAWTRFGTLQAKRHNVLQDNLTALAEDFTRILNERIARILDTATVFAGGAPWSTFTNPTDFRNTNNARVLINQLKDFMVKTLKVRPTITLSNVRVLQDYNQNTSINGVLQKDANVIMDTNAVGPLSNFPGIQHYADDVLTDSTFWMMDPVAANILKGPAVTVTYTNVQAQVLGVIQYVWQNFGIKKQSAIRRITGITA
jgi:hypothetical protein